MSTPKSQHYNHPYWPSPLAARIAKMVLAKGTWSMQRYTDRLTHDKALEVLAHYMYMSLQDFLRLKPLQAVRCLGLATNEKEARAIIGSDYRRRRWSRRYFGKPCCVCDRILDPVPEPEEPELQVIAATTGTVPPDILFESFGSLLA
jgi:hypothetical protein